MQRCAIYARVSDEVQTKGESVDHQISFMREFARRRSEETMEQWETPDELIYRDDGITGTSMLRRPNVMRMILDAQQNCFDIVLFKGISRFARNTVDALLMLQTLKISGVRIISFEENFDSSRDHTELIFTMHSAVAQYESEKTGIRVRIGNFEKARAGKWCGATPEGYVLDSVSKILQVDSARSWLIRHIYSEYLSGKGCWTIASELNEQGISTKRGAKFSAKRIREILTNRVYTGDVIYGRREQKLELVHNQDLLTRKKRSVLTDNPSHLAVCENAHEAIISKDIFTQVQKRFAGRKSKPGRRGRIHLLSNGLLHCACGAPMRAKVNHIDVAYYTCSKRYMAGKRVCEHPSIRAELIEEKILLWLRTMIQDRIHSIDLKGIDFDRIKINSLQDQYHAIQLQIKKEKQKLTRLIESWVEQKLSEEQFMQIKQLLTNRVNRLIQASETILTDIKRNDRTFDTRVTDAIQTLEQLLTVRTLDRRRTKEIISSLIKHIAIIESYKNRVSFSITVNFKE